MPFNFVGGSSKPLFSIGIISLSFLDLLSFFLEFGEFAGKVVPLVYELSHLRQQDNIGQVETAILVIVVKVCIRVYFHLKNYVG